MKVTKVHVERTFNLGEYNSLKVGFEAELSEGEKPLDASYELEFLTQTHYENRTKQQAPKAIAPPQQPAPKQATPPTTQTSSAAHTQQPKAKKEGIAIREIQDGMKRVNTSGKAVEKSGTREVKSQVSNQTYLSANVTIADESASIKLVLWNEDIDKVNVGDLVVIENGYVTSYQGEPQLNVGKWGKLIVQEGGQ